MKTKVLTCATLLLACCIGAGSAFAQGMEGDGNEKNGPMQKPNARPGVLADPVAEQLRISEARALALRERQQQRGARDNRGRYERGAGPEHQFHRGDRLPPQYRGRQYVVEDWRGHHLKAPPRGYHWVQTGGDYVLAAIATGVILELLLNN